MIENINNTGEFDRRAVALLKRFYGYDTFRPGQMDIIKAGAGHKRDALVLMPTGGGKSLCYQLPALLNDGCAIVVSPLIALMHDQVSALVSNGIPAATVNSAIDEATNRSIMEQFFAGRVKLLYISPERLLAEVDHWPDRVPVSLVAIDEAHCISQWGHDFRPVYMQLSRLKSRFPGIPFLALTATADRLTRTDIAVQLGLQDPFVWTGSFDRPNLSLKVLPNPGKSKRVAYICDMIDRHKDDAGIVYSISRKATEKLHKELVERGYKAVCYHAGMSSEEREISQRKFINGDA
ncbi:MAG: RecQ family ATP-dependent DNA helicase, partial [Muribaculaceae bacterium]|nr:RecQ family ATP-dependent DNA helicase [Muribaculaceae bacterium]